MPYNYLGDLYKGEIVSCLQKRGFSVKNVRELNKILEKMGVLIHQGNHWLTSKEGVKFTIYSSQVFDADAWHPAIIEEICEFLSSK